MRARDRIRAHILDLLAKERGLAVKIGQILAGAQDGDGNVLADCRTDLPAYSYAEISPYLEEHFGLGYSLL